MALIPLKKLAEAIKKIQKSNRDCVIVIDGRTGEGKTTLAIQLMKKIKRIIGPFQYESNIKKNIIYSQDEFKKRINESEEEVIIVDEGSFVLFKRDYMYRKQKEILKLLEICRYKKHCIIICVPFFWGLDSHLLRSGKIKLRIFIPTRSKGIIFKPDIRPFTLDPWNTTYNQKAEQKMKVQYHHENYVGRIIFKKLKDWEYKIYEEFKKKKKEEIEKSNEDENEDETEKFKPEVYKAYILFKGGKHSLKEIADIVGVTDRTIRNWRDKYFKEIEKEQSEELEIKEMVNNNASTIR